MDLWLVGEHRGERLEFPLEEGATCTVGRSAGNDLTLPSQTVSRSHARIRREGDSVFVTDLDSLNGTRINGETVEEERRTSPGDLIEFGSVTLKVSDSEGTSLPTWTDESGVSESIQLSREDTHGDAVELAGQDAQLLHLLTEAGQLLVVPGDPQDTFDRVLELVERAIPASRIILLLAENGDKPVQRAARVHGARALSPLMLSHTMVRRVIDHGSSFLTRDAQMDERFMDQQSIVAQDLHSAMAAPLVHGDEIMGVLYVDTSDPVKTYAEHDLRVLTLLGQMLGVKIANARLLVVARERERLEEELRTAAAIQRRLLPQALPDVGAYEIVGLQETCEEVGGDLYDAGLLPDGRCQIVLGDVSGKGIGAALLMSDVLGTIRALRGVGTPPGELVTRLDRQLLATTEAEHYVTLFLAELDAKAHRLDFVNAGHPPALMLLPGGETRALESSDGPPGLINRALLGLPDVEFRARTVEFPPGALLVVYSDGITEARRGEDLFGDERLASVIEECTGLAAAECADRIVSAVDSFAGDEPRLDDITLVLVRRPK